MGATKDQQVKHVVEGLALGVLAAGVEALTGNKMVLELNFNWVWRRWSPAGWFPSIAGHDPGNLFWIGLRKSERRRWSWAAWESDGPWLRPYLVQDWSVEECLDELADERASTEDWEALGRLYVERFKPEQVLRAS